MVHSCIHACVKGATVKGCKVKAYKLKGLTYVAEARGVRGGRSRHRRGRCRRGRHHWCVLCVQIHACVKGVLLQTQNKKGIKVSGTYIVGYCLAETPVRRL